MAGTDWKASDSLGQTMTAASAASTSVRDNFRDLVAGDVVGEYVIEALLGEGGMGQVYAAVHPLIGKKAAIKVLRLELCMRTDSVERFIREARAVNQIGHPNIVDIFAFGELADHRSYFVMEKLAGETLLARMERKRLSRNELCSIGDSIASALDAAHEKQIIHRDLKPENIFLQSVRGKPAVVKLLDFGIAKLTGDDDQRLESTRTGAMLGTPMYIAPEQARGLRIDHRVDIYSLGVMFFEIVVGQLPFEAESAMDLVMKHISEAPPTLASLDPKVPPILDELVDQMLAKDPNQRPTLARVCEVLAALHAMPNGDIVYATATHDGAALRPSAVLRRATRSGLTTTGTRQTRASGESAFEDSAARGAPVPSLSTTAAERDNRAASSRRGRWIIAGVLATAAAVTAVIMIKKASPVAQVIASPPVVATVPIVAPTVPAPHAASVEPLPARENVTPIRVTASSTHKQGSGYSYVAEQLSDGNLSTSWQPSDATLPASVQLDFARDLTVTAVKIANGFQIKDQLGDEFVNNARIAKGRLQFSDGSELPIQFAANTRGFVSFAVANQRTRSLTLMIDEIYDGAKFRKDLAISEIVVEALKNQQ